MTGSEPATGPSSLNAREGLPKRERLAKTADFRRVYDDPTAARGGGVVFLRRENGLAHNRIGFSVGTRNIKRANRRNRMKRLFRECYRLQRQKLVQGNDIVMVVKRDLGETFSYTDASKLFIKLAKESGILK